MNPLLPALAALMLSAMPALSERVSVLVFDASGSMWNRVEGDLTRIEVARDVMGDYFGSRDGAVPLSVIAYGHNRRGDCGDIEVIAPMGQTPARDLEARLRALMPRGMTPLTDSLAMARDQIPATAEAADIILVTDGLETCEGDPCALAASLAAEGIDIRAHVVGFGLTRAEVEALSCITDQTGGLLFETNSGAELAQALQQVSAAPPPEPDPEPAPPEAAFDLDAKAEAGFTYTITWRGDAPKGSYLGFVPQGEPDAPASDGFQVMQEAGGQMTNPVQRRAPEEPGLYDLIIRAPDGTITARQPVEVVAPAMGFDPIGSVPPGSRLRVTFRGPEQLGERIVIADPDQPVAEHQRHDWNNALSAKGALTLTAPTQTGEYELRYLNSAASEVMFARRFGVGIPFEDADLTSSADLAAQAATATRGDAAQDQIASVKATFRLPPGLPDSPVTWDAVPLDPDMAPEAWAPMETAHTVTATFEPGRWRVTALAPGETVYSAEVQIFPGQANDFTLPLTSPDEQDQGSVLQLDGDWQVLAIPPYDAPAGAPDEPIQMMRLTLAQQGDSFGGDFAPTAAMAGPQADALAGRLDRVEDDEGYLIVTFAMPALSPDPFRIALGPWGGQGYSGTMASGGNSVPVVVWPT
ncbi:MAG: vWA domain-containing protein, partial [Paracoccus sp. (in: a-proteobacteria)]